MTRLALNAFFPSGFAAALFMAFAGTASAAGNSSGSMLMTPAYAPMKLACREIATEQQATKLLMRLLPRAKLLSFEPLDLDGKLASCLLEVEMLADKDDQQSKGFVYVLPDGQHFLNGPLMNKRSALSMNPSLPPSVAAALETQKSLVDKAIKQLGEAAPGNVVEHETPAQESYDLSQEPAVDEVAMQKAVQADFELRDRFLKDVSALPSLSTNAGENEVFVMFDPQCAHCKRLYAIHDDIAKRYNLKFNWVPMFLNEESWAMTTHLVKTYKADPNKGLFTLDQMLRTKWVAVDDAAAINSLTEADYMAIKPASLLFYERAKKDPSLGTPLVMFRDPKGEVHVISGVPLDMDWLPLANTDTKKPEA